MKGNMAKKVTPRGLRVRKLADRTGGEESLQADLPGAPPGTWPLAGVVVVGEAPPVASIPMDWARRAAAEGWLELVNARTVQRPAGPAHEPNRELHTFTHADTIVLHCAGGDVTYRVVRQPDKYAVIDRVEINGDKRLGREEIDPTAEVTRDIYAAGDTHVDWSYLAELED